MGNWERKREIHVTCHQIEKPRVNIFTHYTLRLFTQWRFCALIHTNNNYVGLNTCYGKTAANASFIIYGEERSGDRLKGRERKRERGIESDWKSRNNDLQLIIPINKPWRIKSGVMYRRHWKSTIYGMARFLSRMNKKTEKYNNRKTRRRWQKKREIIIVGKFYPFYADYMKLGIETAERLNVCVCLCMCVCDSNILPLDLSEQVKSG